MLSRSDFLKLTGMDAEALKSRTRRGQLPFADDARRHGQNRGWTPFEAFLTLLADELSGGQRVAIATACHIVNAAVPELWVNWGRIADTSGRLFKKVAVPPAEEILVGRIRSAAPRQAFAVAGTMEEIASAALRRGPPVALVLTNVTRAAVELRDRAALEEVPLQESFWLQPDVGGGQGRKMRPERL